MGEPKNPALPKMRDWPMFCRPGGKRHHKKPARDGRPSAVMSELIMAYVPGTPSEKLAWLRAQKTAGKLDGDDPEEIAQAEALLAMLARLAASRGGREKWRHLDELLDEGLKETFPASDPVSVGHFTSTEPPTQPIDRAVVDLTSGGERRVQRTQTRRSRAA